VGALVRQSLVLGSCQHSRSSNYAGVFVACHLRTRWLGEQQHVTLTGRTIDPAIPASPKSASCAAWRPVPCRSSLLSRPKQFPECRLSRYMILFTRPGLRPDARLFAWRSWCRGVKQRCLDSGLKDAGVPSFKVACVPDSRSSSRCRHAPAVALDTVDLVQEFLVKG